MGQVLPDDRFLLCSDGLYKTLELETIASVLMLAKEEGADDAADRLIQAALLRCARDNVTAVIAAP